MHIHSTIQEQVLTCLVGEVDYFFFLSFFYEQGNISQQAHRGKVLEPMEVKMGVNEITIIKLD